MPISFLSSITKYVLSKSIYYSLTEVFKSQDTICFVIILSIGRFILNFFSVNKVGDKSLSKLFQLCQHDKIMQPIFFS